MISRSLIIVACLLMVYGNIFAQYVPLSPELTARLEGKKKFADIMSEVNQYYLEHPDTREEKKWSRWAWFAVRHLNELGEVDYQADEMLDIALKQEMDRTNDQRSNSGVWSFVGPYNTVWANNLGSKGLGRVDRLAFHPTDPNVIYAATPAGGLWRTPDAGNNWFPISSNLPNCGISGIVISEDDPTGNKIFILTGDGDSSPGGFVGLYGFLRPTIGVLVTYDGGFTWSKCGNSQTVLAGLRPYKLIQLRGFPWRLFAATSSGIYYTNDYGNTWSLLAFPGIPIFDIEIHPTDNSIVYASASNTVVKSSDFGSSFNFFPTFNPAAVGATRTAIAVSPANANQVLFLQCGASNRVYQSLNSGDSYTSVNTSNLITSQFGYNCSFAANLNLASTVVVGGINIRSSTDSGQNFGNLTIGNIQWPPPPNPPSNYVHSDIHDLAYHPASNLLYAATDGGVSMSSDNGVNWTDKSNGLTCTQYYHMDGFEGTQNLLIGGGQDNGTAYTTNGAIMNYCGSGDGFAVSFVSGDNNVFYQIENDKQFRFTRSTNTRTGISSHNDSTFFSNILAHPTNSNIVYLGTANGIWRSDNQGAAWTSISSNGTSNSGSGHTGGLAVTAASPNRLYAANATTVWRYENQGGSVTTISGNPGWPGSFGVITDIACRSGHGDEVWVTMTGVNGQNRVFHSQDQGATWTNYTGTLPNVPIYCIVYDNNSDAYIGTELGVYFMDRFMTDWVPFYNGMPLVPVTDLFINETFGTIQAATFGRGIWQSDLYSDCGAFLLLNGLTEGQQFYQSGGFIETTQFVPGSFGNVLRLRSPTKIIFKNNFKILEGGYMRAIIGNCGQGIFNVNGESDDVVRNADNMTKADYLKMMMNTTRTMEHKVDSRL